MKPKQKKGIERPGGEAPFGWTPEEQARWERGGQTDFFKSLWKESKKEKRERRAEQEELALEVARLRAARGEAHGAPHGEKEGEITAERGVFAPIGAAAPRRPAAPAQAPALLAERPGAASPAASHAAAPEKLSLGERLRLKREESNGSARAHAHPSAAPEARIAQPIVSGSMTHSPFGPSPVVSSDKSQPSPGQPISGHPLAPKAVALFDFDGTLTGPGTIGLFFISAAGPFKVLARARDIIADKKALKAGSMSFEETLARAGEWFLGDLTEEQMDAAGARVLRWLRWIPRGWNKKTLARLEALQKLGAHVELVSGSFPWVAKEAARQWGVSCLCSEWEQTGDGWVLRRAMVETAKGERVDQLRAQWPEATVLAFGNSFGDKHMLLKADEPWFVHKMNEAPAKISRPAIAALRA